jgi:hypothetical protein
MGTSGTPNGNGTMSNDGSVGTETSADVLNDTRMGNGIHFRHQQHLQRNQRSCPVDGGGGGPQARSLG